MKICKFHLKLTRWEPHYRFTSKIMISAVKPVFISDIPIDLAIVASLLGSLMGSRWKVENHWRKRWRQRLATQRTNLKLS